MFTFCHTPRLIRYYRKVDRTHAFSGNTADLEINTISRFSYRRYFIYTVLSPANTWPAKYLLVAYLDELISLRGRLEESISK